MYKAIWLLFFPVIVSAQTKIAIIDSGVKPDLKYNQCETGSFDYIKSEPIVNTDDWGHGTNIVKLFQQETKLTDYCILVYRVFSHTKKFKIENNIAAIKTATALDAKIIIMAQAGEENSDEEFQALKEAINKGVKVFVASGNFYENLDYKCDAYPACYKLPLTVVGCKESICNKGKIVSVKEDYEFENEIGSSYSTARAAAKYK